MGALLGGIGVIACLVGGVWLGQGVGAIHGSFMTGRPLWAAIGGVLLVVGLALIAWVARLGRRRGAGA